MATHALKFWIGGKGWGWRLFGISWRSRWFFGLSIADPDAPTIKVCEYYWSEQ